MTAAAFAVRTVVRDERPGRRDVVEGNRGRARVGDPLLRGIRDGGADPGELLQRHDQPHVPIPRGDRG